MNIFYFSRNPAICAKETCDTHIIRGIMDLAFGISKVLNSRCINLPFLYPSSSSQSSPSVNWINSTYANFDWTLLLLNNFCKEYTLRYGKIHAVETRIVDPLLTYQTLSLTYSILDSFKLDTISATNTNRSGHVPNKLAYFYAPPKVVRMPRKVRGYPLMELDIYNHVEYHSLRTILAYREYYRRKKVSIAKWKNGPPLWWVSGKDDDIIHQLIQIERNILATTRPRFESVNPGVGPRFRRYEIERPIGTIQVQDPFTTIQWA